MHCYVSRKAGPDIAGKTELSIYLSIIINVLNEAEDN
jgi:hypothetical protein